MSRIQDDLRLTATVPSAQMAVSTCRSRSAGFGEGLSASLSPLAEDARYCCGFGLGDLTAPRRLEGVEVGVSTQEGGQAGAVPLILASGAAQYTTISAWRIPGRSRQYSLAGQAASSSGDGNGVHLTLARHDDGSGHFDRWTNNAIRTDAHEIANQWFGNGDMQWWGALAQRRVCSGMAGPLNPKSESEGNRNSARSFAQYSMSCRCNRQHASGRAKNRHR